MAADIEHHAGRQRGVRQLLAACLVNNVCHRQSGIIYSPTYPIGNDQNQKYSDQSSSPLHTPFTLALPQQALNLESNKYKQSPARNFAISCGVFYHCHLASTSGSDSSAFQSATCVHIFSPSYVRNKAVAGFRAKSKHVLASRIDSLI